MYAFSGYYRNPYFKSHLDELQTTCATVIFGSFLYFFAIVIDDVPLIDDDRVGLIKLLHVSPRVYIQILLTMFCSVFIPVYFCRLALTHWTNNRIRRGEIGLRTLLVGNGKAAAMLVRELRESRRNNGYRIVGCIGSGHEKSVRDIGVSCFGEYADRERVVREQGIEAFLIASDVRAPKVTFRIVYDLMPFDCPIRLKATPEEIMSGLVRTGSLTSIPMIEYGVSRLTPFRRNLKRAGDILGSAVALVLLSPLLVLLACCIKADSEGRIIYAQERIGRCGRPFRMYKFRSMRSDAEADGPQLSRPDDGRVTRVGHILRKYRLDELPQFWNVLLGDMSLVGPRPERAFYIRQIMELAPYYSKLLQVRPGITSWGMVKFGYAGNVFQMVERMRYDLMYLDNCSLAVDLKIIGYTVRTVVTGKGI